MKKLLLFAIALISISASSQNKTELKKHFEAYYNQMKTQGDVQGVINAITHLNVLESSQARMDTLAYIYVSEGRFVEALNTIGIEKSEKDSNMNIEVKAIALKSLNQPKLSLEHYEILFKRQPTANTAYELTELKLQLQDVPGARVSVDYGLANVTDDMKRSFYESQQPYQTSMKAALLYLQALVVFNEDKNENVEKALATLNRALAIDPNFNMAKITKDALLVRKKE